MVSNVRMLVDIEIDSSTRNSDTRMLPYDSVSPMVDLIPKTSARVMIDHTTTEPGELSLLKGDVSTLLQLKDHGWCVLLTTVGL